MSAGRAKFASAGGGSTQHGTGIHGSEISAYPQAWSNAIKFLSFCTMTPCRRTRYSSYTGVHVITVDLFASFCCAVTKMAGLNGAPREDVKLRSSFTIINEWLMSMNDNNRVSIKVCHDLLVSHLIRTSSLLIEQQLERLKRLWIRNETLRESKFA